MSAFVLQTACGLEDLLWNEVHGLDEAARRGKSVTLTGRNTLLEVDAPSADPLLRARIAEDVFALVAEVTGLGPDFASLKRTAPDMAPQRGVDAALAAHTAAVRRPARGRRRFRVVTRADGDRHWHRSDLGLALARQLELRLGPRWHAVDEDGDLEFWVTVVRSNALITLRLSPADHRRRDKRVHFAGSLRPQIAAAMARLSEPRDDDVVLDPFCGGGTLLIERALAGRYAQLIGADNSPAAIDAARANIGRRHQPCQLVEGDAGAIALEADSVDAVLTNPPFGRKVGAGTDVARLRRAFLAEARRVVRPGGRMIVAWPHGAALPSTADWALGRRVPITVQGLGIDLLLLYPA